MSDAAERNQRLRELNQLCERELLPAIAELDRTRRGAVQKLKLMFVIAASGGIMHLGATDGLHPLAIAAFVVIAGCFGGWSTILYKRYQASFKHQVMGRLVSTLFPSFKYSPEGSIAKSTYAYSQLFPRSYDSYAGEDYCQGRVRETDVEFSELHTQYKVRSGKNTRWVTIFNGVFVHADFHKHLKGRTFVTPDLAEKVLGSWLGGLLQDAATMVDNRGERIRLEHPEFEKQFAVMSTNPQEARYVLTPAMQEKILGLRQKFGATPYLSFIEGRVFLAIGDQKDFLEPHFFRALAKEDIFRLFAVFSAITEIVDDLDLNTRIWSKA